MLETYTTVLTQASRTLKKNAMENKILYFLFGSMLIFSIMMMAGITMFSIQEDFGIDLQDVLYLVFFIFLLKTIADVHRFVVKSEELTYTLSQPVHHRKTFFEVFLYIFWSQLGIWALFSGLYTVFLAATGTPLGYPIEYLQFTVSVIFATLLGWSIGLHFFSSHRLRLIPASILLTAILYSPAFPLLLIYCAVSLVYLLWGLPHGLDSYLFIERKQRTPTSQQLTLTSQIHSLFFKETTVLWRDRLLPSFVITAVLVGGGAGYLTVFGINEFSPEALLEELGYLLPYLFIFIGIYIMVIYTAVFPGLNMFFIEEHTLWLFRHLPLDTDQYVHGKTSSLLLCFISSLPCLWCYAAFTGPTYLLFSLWFLVFSYLICVIIAVPLGVRYVGKKSDILVLYSVALLIFILLSIGVGIYSVIPSFLRGWIFIGSLLALLPLLYSSQSLAAFLLRVKPTPEGLRMSQK